MVITVSVSCGTVSAPAAPSAPSATAVPSASAVSTRSVVSSENVVSAAPIVSADGSLTWGDGSYGVVLAHGAAFDASSWTDQAVLIAAHGCTVIAVQDTGSDGLHAAIEQLQGAGITRIALVGGSAGIDSVLRLAVAEPELADQLIGISPNSTVTGLGSEPKLFIASEGETVAQVSVMLAEQSPGSDNKSVLLPGSAHAQNIFATDQGPALLEQVLNRIDERIGS